MDWMQIGYAAVSIGGLGIVFGAGLGYASKKFAVEVDPMVPMVREALPGANCGACGFAGCDAYAQAVVGKTAPANGCPVGGADVAIQIGEILGIKVETKEKSTAFVKCNGTHKNAKEQAEYYGILDCNEAAMIPGGGAKSCSFGCLGLGSCKKVCAFGAIEMREGVAKIIEEKCTSCGQCVGACPKALIEIIPASRKVRVLCNSVDKGKEVKENCSVGCIGCKMCVKACEQDAIKFENNLAKVNYEKCTHCMACVAKCPTKSIVLLED